MKRSKVKREKQVALKISYKQLLEQKPTTWILLLIYLFSLSLSSQEQQLDHTHNKMYERSFQFVSV